MILTYVINKSHEGHRSIGETERHDHPLIQTKPFLEWHISGICNIHMDMMAPKSKVHPRKESSAMQLIH